MDLHLTSLIFRIVRETPGGEKSRGMGRDRYVSVLLNFVELPEKEREMVDNGGIVNFFSVGKRMRGEKKQGIVASEGK